MLPTDGSTPASARRSVYLIETYCTLISSEVNLKNSVIGSI